jgi:pimeloyl-ACP methyl ester carboxylesterase
MNEAPEMLFLHGRPNGDRGPLGGRVAEIEGAGHDVHLDQPGALAEAINDWRPSQRAQI